MVFLLKKAAIAALIATGLTIGAFNYFAQESAKNRARTRNQGGGDGTMFESSYTNRSRPRLLFRDNLFQSPSRSNVPCNCQVITNCPNLKPGGNIRGRHCGFQGFQRKICCDDADTSAPKITDEQIEDAYKQKALVEIYRNPDIFRNESQFLDPGSSQSDEDNNDQASPGKSPGSLSPLDILSMEAGNLGRSSKEEIPPGGEKLDSAEQYVEGGPPSYSDSRRTGIIDSIESLFPSYYDSDGSDKKPQQITPTEKNRTAKVEDQGDPAYPSLREFFPDYYEEFLNIFRNSTDSINNKNNNDTFSSTPTSADDSSSSRSSVDNNVSVTDKSEPSFSEVSGSTTIINSIDTSSLRPDDNPSDSDVVTSMSVSMEKSSYVTSKSFTMNNNNKSQELAEPKQGDPLGDETVINNNNGSSSSSSSGIPSEAIPTSVSMVMSISSGGQSTRNTTSKSITMTVMSSQTTEAGVTADMQITTSTTETSNTLTFATGNQGDPSTSTTGVPPEYSEGMVTTGAPGEVGDLRLLLEDYSPSTSSLSSSGSDETKTESLMLSDNLNNESSSKPSNINAEESSTMSSTSSLSSQSEKSTDSHLPLDYPSTTLTSISNDSQTTLIPETSSSPIDEDKTKSSTNNIMSTTTSSPTTTFVPTSSEDGNSSNEEPITTTLPTLSLPRTTTPSVSFTPEKTTLPSESEQVNSEVPTSTLPPSLDTPDEKEPGNSLMRDEFTTGSSDMITTLNNTFSESNKDVITNSMMMEDRVNNDDSSVSDDAPAPEETTTPSHSGIDNDTRINTVTEFPRIADTTTDKIYTTTNSPVKLVYTTDASSIPPASSSTVTIDSIVGDIFTSSIAPAEEFATTTSSSTGSQIVTENDGGGTSPSLISREEDNSQDALTEASNKDTNNETDLGTTMSSSSYGGEIVSPTASSTTEFFKTETTTDSSEDPSGSRTTVNSQISTITPETVKDETATENMRITSETIMAKSENRDELLTTTTGKSEDEESGSFTTSDSIGSSTEQSQSTTLKPPSDDISITSPSSVSSADETTTPFTTTEIDKDGSPTTPQSEAKQVKSDVTGTPETMSSSDSDTTDSIPLSLASTESSYGIDYTSPSDSSTISSIGEGLRKETQELEITTPVPTSNPPELLRKKPNEGSTTTVKSVSITITTANVDTDAATTEPSLQEIQTTTQDTLKPPLKSPENTLSDKATTIMPLEEEMTTLSGVVGISGSSTPSGLLSEMELTTSRSDRDQNGDSITDQTQDEHTTLSPSIQESSTESFQTLGDMITSTFSSIKEFFTSTASYASDDGANVKNSTPTSLISDSSSTQSLNAETESPTQHMQSTLNPDAHIESSTTADTLGTMHDSSDDVPTTAQPQVSSDTEAPGNMGQPDSKISSADSATTMQTFSKESIENTQFNQSEVNVETTTQQSTSGRSQVEFQITTDPSDLESTASRKPSSTILKSMTNDITTDPTNSVIGVIQDKNQLGTLTSTVTSDGITTTTNQPELDTTVNSITSIPETTEASSSSTSNPQSLTTLTNTEEVTTIKDESLSSILESTTSVKSTARLDATTSSSLPSEQDSTTLKFKSSDMDMMSEVSTVPTPYAVLEDLSDTPTTTASWISTDDSLSSTTTSSSAASSESLSSAPSEMTTPLSPSNQEDSLSSTISNYPDTPTINPNPTTEPEAIAIETSTEMRSVDAIDTSTNGNTVSNETPEQHTTIKPDETKPTHVGELSDSMGEIVTTTSIPRDSSPQGDNNNESHQVSSTTVESEGSLLDEDNMKVTSSTERTDEGITETTQSNNEGVTTEVSRNDMSTTTRIVTTTMKGVQNTESPKIKDNDEQINMKRIKDSTTINSLMEDVMATVQSLMDSIMSTTTEKPEDKSEDIQSTTMPSTPRNDSSRSGADVTDAPVESETTSTKRTHPSEIEVTTLLEGLEMTTALESQSSSSTNIPEITTTEDILKTSSISTTIKPEETTLQNEMKSTSKVSAVHDEVDTVTTSKPVVANTELPAEIFTSVNLFDESETSTAISKSSTDEATTMNYRIMNEYPVSSRDKPHKTSTHSPAEVIIIGTDEPATTPESMSLLNAYQTTLAPSNEPEKITEVPTTLSTTTDQESTPKTTTLRATETSNVLESERTTFSIPMDDLPQSPTTEESLDKNVPTTPEYKSQKYNESTRYETSTTNANPHQSTVTPTLEVTTLTSNDAPDTSSSISTSESRANRNPTTTEPELTLTEKSHISMGVDDSTELPTTQLPVSNDSLNQEISEMSTTTGTSSHLPEDLSYTTQQPQESTSFKSHSSGGSSRSIELVSETRTISSADEFETTTTAFGPTTTIKGTVDEADKSSTSTLSSTPLHDATTTPSQSYEITSTEVSSKAESSDIATTNRPDSLRPDEVETTVVPESSTESSFEGKNINLATSRISFSTPDGLPAFKQNSIETTTVESTSKSLIVEEILDTTTRLPGDGKEMQELSTTTKASSDDEVTDGPSIETIMRTTSPSSDLVKNEEEQRYSTSPSSISDLAGTTLPVSSTISPDAVKQDISTTLSPISGDQTTTEMSKSEMVPEESEASSGVVTSTIASADNILAETTTTSSTRYQDDNENTEEVVSTSTEASKDFPSTTLKSLSMYGIMDMDEMETTMPPITSTNAPLKNTDGTQTTSEEPSSLPQSTTVSASYGAATSTELSKTTKSYETTTLISDMQSEMESTSSPKIDQLNSSPNSVLRQSNENGGSTMLPELTMSEVTSTPTSLNEDLQTTTVSASEFPTTFKSMPSSTESSQFSDTSTKTDETTTQSPITSDSSDLSTVPPNKSPDMYEMNLNLNMDLQLASTLPSLMSNDDTLTDLESSAMMTDKSSADMSTTAAPFSRNDQSTTKPPAIISFPTSEPLLPSTLRNIGDEESEDTTTTVLNLMKDETTTVIPSNPTLLQSIISDNTSSSSSSVGVKGLSLIKSDTTDATTTTSSSSETEEISSTSSSARDLLLDSSTPGTGDDSSVPDTNPTTATTTETDPNTILDLLEKDTDNSTTKANHSNGMSQSVEITQITIDDDDDKATTSKPESYSPTEKVFHGEVGTTTLNPQSTTERPKIQIEEENNIPTTESSQSIVETTTGDSYEGDETTTTEAAETKTKAEKVNEPFFVLNITEILPTKIIELVNMTRVIYDENNLSEEQRDSTERQSNVHIIDATTKQPGGDILMGVNDDVQMTTTRITTKEDIPSASTLPSSISKSHLSESSTEQPNDTLGLISTQKSNPTEEQSESTTSAIDISFDEMETLKPTGIQDDTEIHSVSGSTTTTTDHSAAVSTMSLSASTTTLSMTQEDLDEIDEAYSTPTTTTSSSSHNAGQLHSTESSSIRENGTSQDLLLIPDEGISTTLSSVEENVPTTSTTTSASLPAMTNNSQVIPARVVNETIVDSAILITTTTSSPVSVQNDEDFTTTTDSATAQPNPTFSLVKDEQDMNESKNVSDDDVTETPTLMAPSLQETNTLDTTTTTSFPRNQTPSKIVSKYETTTVETGGVSRQDSTISDSSEIEFPTTTATEDSITLGNIMEEDFTMKVNQSLESPVYATSETAFQTTTKTSSIADDDNSSQTTVATNEDLNASTSTVQDEEAEKEQIENTSVYFLADETEQDTKDSTTSISLQEDSLSSSPSSVIEESSTPSSLMFNEEPVTSISSMITNQTSRITVLRPTTMSPNAPNDPRTSTDITHSVRKLPESDRTVVELVRELSKVKTKITHSINSIKNSNVELHDEATTTAEPLETSTMPSITTTPDFSEYPTNPYGYSLQLNEDAATTTPTTTANTETTYATTTNLPSGTNNQTTISIEIETTTLLSQDTSLTFDESSDSRESEHLTNSKHQTGNDVHGEDQITPIGIISTTTEITKSSEEITKVPSVSLKEDSIEDGKPGGRNESEWKEESTDADAAVTEDSLVLSTTTTFTQETGMEEEETFQTTSEGPTIITLDQTNRSTETYFPSAALPSSTSSTSSSNSSLLSSSSRNQRLFDGGDSSSVLDVENTFEKSPSPITTKQQPTIASTSTAQTILFEVDERTTTTADGTIDEEKEATDIPRSTTQITQPLSAETYSVVNKDDLTPNSFIDFSNETTSRFLGNETTERSLNLQGEAEISNVGNSTEEYFTFHNNETRSGPEINFDYLETTAVPNLNSTSSSSSFFTTDGNMTQEESTIKSVQSSSSHPPPTSFETIVTLGTPSPSEMPPITSQEDISLMEAGQLTTTTTTSSSYESSTTKVINNDTITPTTTSVSHSTELIPEHDNDDHENISAAESNARSETLFNLYNEIFQPVGPAPVENSTEKYPHNHHHHHHHHANYNTQRKNSRKLILEVVTPPPTTTPSASQVIDVDEDADEFFKTPTALSHPGVGVADNEDEVTSSTTTSTTQQESPKLKVRVKVGPGGDISSSVSSSPSPGRPQPPLLIKAGRELFPSEAKEIEQELNNQISNVVNQLLLTTHENFRLLPSFLECAAASSRKARRKTRVLNFDTENHPWMARIGYQERGGLTFSCSGTIISQRYILTSATCAHKHEGRITDVLLESIKHTDISSSPDNNSTSEPSSQYKLKVQGVYSHPQYDPKSRLNDLALIRLREEIGFNSTSDVRPICLPFEDGYGVWDSLPRPGDLAYLGGWGFEQNNSTKKIADLNESSVKIWSNQNCSRAYAGDAEKRVTSQQLCAYSSREKVCRGDAGAPLMAVMTRHRIFFQIGVVSYGPQCGYQVPRVYTRVSEYLKWILDSMDP